jgi:rRNA small subunit pseudouridine methyltransferase Nep1
MILDNSYHFAAMKKLSNSIKRGRPDIVHFALMEALSTPLFQQRKLRVYVHTINDKIIAIADNLRIPKTYFRFERLMAKLFAEGHIRSDDGDILMEVTEGTFELLLRTLRPDNVVGLSTTGVRSTAAEVARVVAYVPGSAIVIGAFPRGPFF